MRYGFDFKCKLMFVGLVFLICSSPCLSVSSKITRHSSSVDLLKGQLADVVVSSRGTIQLGRHVEVLADEFDDVWSINDILVTGDGTVYFGTSPNGGVYEYSVGKLTKLYPLQSDASSEDEPGSSPVDDVNEPNDVKVDGQGEIVETEQHLVNEHIFAMAMDISGRLLVGVSGEKCQLMRLKAGEMETIFEPNEAKYIFAIAIANDGNIYLGTGPEGKIYELSSFGTDAEIIYESSDKNILSLAVGKHVSLYAGTDGRGLIYKINPRKKRATVLYDSDQEEITALLFGEDGDLYATATSAKIVSAQTKFASQLPMAGRPEKTSKDEKTSGDSNNSLKLKIANTKKDSGDKKGDKGSEPQKRAKSTDASFVYKITKDGFATDIFSESVVFFCLAKQDQQLLVGTGNNGQLFMIDPSADQESIVYEDEQSSQITTATVWQEDVYLGTANPPKLLRLSKVFALEGTYTSDLIDAGQPGKWGKLQIEADIPQDCKVLAASRSGNVKDANDPTFSDWTELIEVTGPIQLRCPVGRFCQYKLVLTSGDGKKSPIIKEIAVASTVPNLAPKVESVSISRLKEKEKHGVFKIQYKAVDDNKDKLIYRIDFRKIGRGNWIKLEDEIESASFDWDGKTLEDGRYEIKVTASDERDNSTETQLTGSRISDTVVVDNTGPTVDEIAVLKGSEKITLKLKVSDELSAIGKLQYTVDSNADWKGAMPDDMVYDTTEEDFTITIEKLEAGEHVIAIKIVDDIGNTTYKTLEVNL